MHLFVFPSKPPQKAKEEVEQLEKKMQQLEHELGQTQTNLDTASHNLEEKEKALQNVCHGCRSCAVVCVLTPAFPPNHRLPYPQSHIVKFHNRNTPSDNDDEVYSLRT